MGYLSAGDAACYDESNPDWSCSATPSTVTQAGTQIASVQSSGGDVGRCTQPQIYVQYYGSCVDPCPASSTGGSQHYDPKTGICVPDTGLSTMAMVGIGIGVVAGYMLLFGKKGRRRR